MSRERSAIQASRHFARGGERWRGMDCPCEIATPSIADSRVGHAASFTSTSFTSFASQREVQETQLLRVEKADRRLYMQGAQIKLSQSGTPLQSAGASHNTQQRRLDLLPAAARRPDTCTAL